MVDDYDFKTLNKVEEGGENWTYFSQRNENSYMIGDGRTVIVFENGQEIFKGEIAAYEDVTYSRSAECYFIAQKNFIYKKEINATAPSPFFKLSSPCHTSSKNVILSCEANKKLLVLQEGLKISVINPFNAKKEVTLEFDKITRVVDFLLIGESQDSFAVLGECNHILLFDSHLKKALEGKSYYLCHRINGPAWQLKVMFTSCPRGQYLLVVTGMRSRRSFQQQHTLRTIKITEEGLENVSDVQESFPGEYATSDEINHPDYLVIPNTSLSCVGYKSDQLLCLTFSETDPRVRECEEEWDVRMLRFDGKKNKWEQVFGVVFVSRLYDVFQRFGEDLYSVRYDGHVQRLSLKFSPM